MLQFVTDLKLSAAARGQLEAFIDALSRELVMPKRRETESAAGAILAFDAAARRPIAAALAELADRLPHDSFEAGGERFAAELRRYARLFDPEHPPAARGGPYFSHIRRAVLGPTARELLALYFDARLTDSGLEEAESRLLTADAAVRAQSALALLELHRPFAAQPGAQSDAPLRGRRHALADSEQSLSPQRRRQDRRPIDPSPDRARRVSGPSERLLGSAVALR